jgi:hypothetical protein
MLFLDSFVFSGSSRTQTSWKEGTCSIFFSVPVLCPRLITSSVMQSLMRNTAELAFVDSVLYFLLDLSLSCNFYATSLNWFLSCRYFW